MRTIAVNENNDIFIGTDGNLVIVDGIESVTQRCEQAARILKEELPYAQSKGIPFFQAPFGDTSNLSLYESYLRQQYMAVQEVTGVKYIRFRFEGNELQYEAGILSIYGEANISGNL